MNSPNWISRDNHTEMHSQPVRQGKARLVLTDHRPPRSATSTRLELNDIEDVEALACHMMAWAATERAKRRAHDSRNTIENDLSNAMVVS